MSDRLLVGTKKGLFELRRAHGTWSIESTRFLGDPISMLLYNMVVVLWRSPRYPEPYQVSERHWATSELCTHSGLTSITPSSTFNAHWP